MTYEGSASSDYSTPDMSLRDASANVKDICTMLGVTVDPETVCTLLTKMQVWESVEMLSRIDSSSGPHMGWMCGVTWGQCSMVLVIAVMGGGHCNHQIHACTHCV